MKTKQGFSLIELVFYISILSFITVVIVDAFIGMSRLGARGNTAESLTRSSLIALGRLDREVRSAQSVSVLDGELVLDGNILDLSSFIETGIQFENLSFNLDEASTSVKVQTSFTLNGENYYSTSVLRHKQ